MGPWVRQSVNFPFFFEAGHILKMFLFLEKFEPQRSYKHGSYKKACISEPDVLINLLKQGQPGNPLFSGFFLNLFEFYRFFVFF